MNCLSLKATLLHVCLDILVRQIIFVFALQFYLTLFLMTCFCAHHKEHDKETIQFKIESTIYYYYYYIILI